MAQVISHAGIEVVEHADGLTGSGQRLDQMGANKARAASNQCNFRHLVFA